MNNRKLLAESDNLYAFAKELIIEARKKVHQTANFVMVETYWLIGKKIIEEQGGEIQNVYALRKELRRITANQLLTNYQQLKTAITPSSHNIFLNFLTPGTP
jgi:hypothetical protein